MTQPIKLIAVDLDGTLLNSKHQMSKRNEKALKAAIAKGVQVIIATAKTRTSASDIVKRLELTTQGIYLHGLAIYNADGSLAYQKTLEPAIARQVLTFAEDRGFYVIAYSGTRILVRSSNSRFEQYIKEYNEALPEIIGPIQNILGDMPINKLLITRFDEAKRVKALRWQLSMQLDDQANVTGSIRDDMLEVMPPNISKSVTLAALIKQAEIKAENVMAIGDGGNDIDMIEMAGIGVAMGNARQALKDKADHIVADNDHDGVAEAVEKFVLASSNVPTEVTQTNGDKAQT